MDMYSWVLFLFATCLPTAWLVDQKALEEFVNLRDPHYKYTFLKRMSVPDFLFANNLDTINMTSQKWLDESEVDKPVWSHELKILVPLRKTLEFIADSSLLIILPGENNESTSSLYSLSDLTLTTGRTKTIVALLSPVPFQPLTFYNHPLGHSNITGLDIFAYSWWRFMNDSTAPPHWLVEFPMVKAIVRAMDTITHYVKKEYHVKIRRFTLLGVSMGGWVSWLAAAVDKRVEAIVPIGMDFLNFNESFHHQYRAYCGWSYMMRPFYEMNITQELDNPRFNELASHVDPMAYNEQCANVTKYIIVLSGDEFSQPDNSRHYFSQLEGVKYFQIIPNSDYRFQLKHRLLDYVLSFYFRMVYKEYGFPKVSWEITMTNTSATILVRTFHAYQVYSYHADTVGGTRRDFRMRIAAGKSSKKSSIKWKKTELYEMERNVYKGEMQKSKKGWRAFFLQVLCIKDEVMTFFRVTSDIVIMPDTFPCHDCNGDGCHGTLV